MLQDIRSRLGGSHGRASGAEPDGVPPSGPVQVGAEIRAARERQGWSVASVAAELRIRQPYLEAIEAGRVADLPGSAYAIGFLRAYAAAVGLALGAVTAEEIGHHGQPASATLRVPPLGSVWLRYDGE